MYVAVAVVTGMIRRVEAAARSARAPSRPNRVDVKRYSCIPINFHTSERFQAAFQFGFCITVLLMSYASKPITRMAKEATGTKTANQIRMTLAEETDVVAT